MAQAVDVVAHVQDFTSAGDEDDDENRQTCACAFATNQEGGQVSSQPDVDVKCIFRQPSRANDAEFDRLSGGCFHRMNA